MPIKIEWLIENYVVLSTSHGSVTVEESIQSNEELLKFVHLGYAATGKKVHTVSDAKKVLKQPSPLEVRNVFTYLTDPACGEVVVGGIGNPLLYFFAKVVGTVVNVKVSMYDSIEQALHALQAKDSTLPDLIAAYRHLKDNDDPA